MKLPFREMDKVVPLQRIFYCMYKWYYSTCMYSKRVNKTSHKQANMKRGDSATYLPFPENPIGHPITRIRPMQ